jgi:hypothetical protein
MRRKRNSPTQLGGFFFSRRWPNMLIAPTANGTKAKAKQIEDDPSFALAKIMKPKQIKPIEIKKAIVFSINVALHKIWPATFNDLQADFCPNFVEGRVFLLARRP